MKVCVLTLLVGQQEGHLACKNWVIRYWRGYLSEASCKWFAYGPADVTATLSSLGTVKSRMVYLSVPAYPGCPGKRPLNVCGSRSSVKVSVLWCLLQLALRYHPDKNPDNPESTEKVQLLASVSSVVLLRYLKPTLKPRFFAKTVHRRNLGFFPP